MAQSGMMSACLMATSLWAVQTQFLARVRRMVVCHLRDMPPGDSRLANAARSASKALPRWKGCRQRGGPTVAGTRAMERQADRAAARRDNRWVDDCPLSHARAPGMHVAGGMMGPAVTPAVASNASWPQGVHQAGWPRCTRCSRMLSVPKARHRPKRLLRAAVQAFVIVALTLALDHFVLITVFAEWKRNWRDARRPLHRATFRSVASRPGADPGVAASLGRCALSISDRPLRLPHGRLCSRRGRQEQAGGLHHRRFVHRGARRAL